MNILLVSQMNIHSQTGITTYYLSLRDEFVKKGHPVLIITPDDCTGLISFLLKLFRRVPLLIPFKFIRLFVDEFDYFVSIYFAVRKVRNTASWHIIHGQDTSSSCAAKLALRGKVPVVTTCHYNETPVIERELAYKLSKRQSARLTKWFTYLFSKTDNFIFVSNYIYSKSANLIKPDSNIKIIRNGVRFYDKKSIVNESDNFIISNVGTIEERKNQILLIEAASHLMKKGVSFKIWLFGDGPKRAEWEKIVSEKNLTDHIVFWRHKKNVLELIQQSDVYVHTSKNESSCGICVLEAFSIGLPVLALANGGMQEHFPASGVGLIAPDINPSQLADVIVTHFDYAKRSQLQNEQYEYSSSQLTLKNMVDETFDFYNSILSIN